MNTQVKLFFDGHPTVDTFYFTPDGQAFFSMAGASAHSQALEKKVKGSGKITMITRDQMNEWWKEECPKRLAAAEKEVTDAEAAEEAAQKVVDATPKSAGPSKKMLANLALKEATERVAKANAALKVANADMAAIAPEDAATSATTEPEPNPGLVKLNDALEKAQTNLTAAQGAAASLATDAAPADVKAAKDAVDKAQKAVDNIQIAIKDLEAKG